MTKVKLP